ncbi:MAG: DUF4349 domain-containing protein, partial [Treponema sp.]|nr:DUF4349 domain-containing protein [Treponema sp.]
MKKNFTNNKFTNDNFDCRNTNAVHSLSSFCRLPFFLLLTFVFFASACSQKSSRSAGSAYGAKNGSMESYGFSHFSPEGPASSKMTKQSALMDRAADSIMAESVSESAKIENLSNEQGAASLTTSSNTSEDNAISERKLIRHGYISFEVASLSETRLAIEMWVKQFGGYISNSHETSRNIHITVRIPSVHFDSAMNASSNFGKIISKSVSSDDVTEQFYDVESRLQTRRILLSRLQSYLRDARTVSDMLDAEVRINDVTGEIERMQGQLNRLSNQIEYSTINVDAQLPVNQSENGFVLPDTKTAFREFLGNVLSFFSGFIFVVLYIVLFGIPIVLVAFLLYWIAFGKIGLLRKLFSRIRYSKE